MEKDHLHFGQFEKDRPERKRHALGLYLRLAQLPLEGKQHQAPGGESRVCIGWGRGEKESSETSEQDSLGAEGLEEEGVWEL